MAYRKFALWALALGLVIAVPTIVAGLIDFVDHAQCSNGIWVQPDCSSGRYSLSRIAIWMGIGLSAVGLVLLSVGG
jgi:hypothetical protein